LWTGGVSLDNGLKNRKIRICFAATWTHSPHMQAWINYFIRNEKYDVHIITHSKEKVEGAKTYHLVAWSKLKFISGPLQTRWLLRRMRPDILHADSLTPYGFYAALSRSHPMVVSCRGSDVLINPQRSRILACITKFVVKRADLIYAVGDHLSRRLISLGADEAKVTTITIGIDLDKFHPDADKKGEIRKRLGWIENPLVVSTRNFESIYNLDLLIRAMPFVIKENSSVRFIMAGRGTQENYLKGLVDELGMNEYVKFMGYIEQNELPKTLAGADIYVSTSLSDGISVSLLEGMACGCFPVVTDIPANRSWIQDGENGFLVPTDDPKFLADRISSAINSKALMEGARKKNSEQVKQRAAWEEIMRNIEKKYRSLISSTLD
ncbi:MAG: glycosyltransferase family 4 protein, partial [Candidatus Latescibacteria bacterium]|nr:glycosyltransferase family 4 protein [Candidatus Latescibacterota bacterium]